MDSPGAGQTWPVGALRDGLVPERITGVYTTPTLTYPSGDQAQYVIVGFACRVVEGVARVNDDESLEVAFFPMDALPELHPAHRADQGCLRGRAALVCAAGGVSG